MPGQYTAEVSNKERISSEIFRLTFNAPEIATSATPGQFLMLRAGAGLDPLLSRPLSIHQIGEDGRVQVLFKVFGEGTRRLAALEPGGSVKVVGPLGRGFSLQAPGRVCLVGGGMGIAPLFFLARRLREQPAPPLAVELLLGARTAGEIQHFIHEFEEMGLSPRVATDDGSLGHPGLVPDLMALHLDAGERYQVYCCGPTPMMAAVARFCRPHDWPCQVSLETMMACGISACLGCAVKTTAAGAGYKHVCKDGPVFAAQDVVWPIM